MTDEAITVDVHGERLGTLRQTPRGAQWHASDQALDRYGIGSLVLSVALPLDSSPSSVAASEAFFGGLRTGRVPHAAVDRDPVGRTLPGLARAVEAPYSVRTPYWGDDAAEREVCRVR